MISRETILGIGGIVGYFALFVGAMGQAAFLSPVLKSHPLKLMVGVIPILLPSVIVYGITFTRQPFLPPRQFRLYLLFSMGGFAATTIAAEVLHLLGQMPPDGPKYPGAFARVLMHTGWLSFLYTTPLYISVRRFESKAR